MQKGLCLIAVLAVVLQTNSVLPSCVGQLKYSQGALEYIFQAQKFQLQEALSNITIVPVHLGATPDITEILLDGIDILHISARLIPNIGVQVSVNIDLHLTSKDEHSELHLRVLTDVISDLQFMQDVSSNLRLNINTCETSILELRVSPIITSQESLEKQVINLLNSKLCLTLSNIFLGLNVQLGELRGLINFGAYVQVKYFLCGSPMVTGNHIELGFNAQFLLLGKVLNISADTEHINVPTHSGSDGFMYNLLLPEETFGAAFSAMEWAGAFNLYVSSEKTTGVDQLTTDKLRPVSPEIPKMYPQNLPIIMKVGASKTSKVSLHKDKIILHLKPSVELMVRMPEDLPQESLMLLSMDVQMTVQIKISESKLKTDSLALNRRITLLQKTSAVGSINVEKLQEIIVPLLEGALLFHYKEAMGIGWTLPNLFNLQIVQPIMEVEEGICCGVGKPSISEVKQDYWMGS